MGSRRRGAILLCGTLATSCSVLTSLDGYTGEPLVDAGSEDANPVDVAPRADASSDADADAAALRELDPSWTPKWQNIVAYWKLDGDGPMGTGAKVAATVGGDGVAVNANNTGLAYVPGKVGGAALFDGVDDFIEVEDRDALTPGTAFTFAAWINPASIDEEDTIFNKYAQTDSLDEYVFSVFSDRTPRLAWHTTGSGAWGTPASNGLNGLTPVSLGKWSHIVAVRSGTSVTIYLDGVNVGSGDVCDSNPILNTTVSLRIGAEKRGGTERCFTGAIDEIAMWNAALTASEVATIYGHQR